MKKLTFLFAAISLLSISKAQITFEYEYDTIQSPYGVLLLAIGDNYYRYVEFDNENYQFSLYNLNHSLDKTVSYPAVSGFPFHSVAFLTEALDVFDLSAIITQSLFNTDNLIEFLVTYRDSSFCKKKLRVYNEIGSILLEIDSANTFYIASVGNNVYKLIVTMISLCPNKYLSTQIYSLPGTLPVGKTEIIGQINRWQIGNSYPNPSNNYTIIDYQLQQGINNGEIVFYDIHGREARRFKVDRTFNHLRLSTTDLSPGTYYYNLQTSQGVSSGKKMVVIK